ncbi:hypothetical protein BRAS3843_520170 [Bradyrhizobium sp. STM 3843]|nr:hypothetical protein BRAS3843_520170 [Bradyrhizobium sp. STM 3843]
MQPPQPIARDGPLHGIDELPVLDGLDEIVDGPRLHRPGARSCFVLCGQKQQGRSSPDPRLLRLKREAAHAGQLDVQHDAMGWTGLASPEKLFGRMEELDRQTCRPEQAAQFPSVGFVTVDDRNERLVGGHGSSPIYPCS